MAAPKVAAEVIISKVFFIIGLGLKTSSPIQPVMARDGAKSTEYNRCCQLTGHLLYFTYLLS